MIKMEYIKFAVTLVIILLIFWMSDSQRKNQNKKIKEFQENVKNGDDIITYSGLCGKVIEVFEDKVTIQAKPSNTELWIEKWAIAGMDKINKEKQKEEN